MSSCVRLKLLNSLMIGLLFATITCSLASRASSCQQKINLNSASAAQLTGSFKGIGKQRAKAIVLYRRTHGEFNSVMDLSHVRGLGRNFVKRNRAKLRKIFTVDE